MDIAEVEISKPAEVHPVYCNLKEITAPVAYLPIRTFYTQNLVGRASEHGIAVAVSVLEILRCTEFLQSDIPLTEMNTFN